MKIEVGPCALHHGDSRDVLAEMPDASIDAVVCDPPYALVSIAKRFGSVNAAPAKGNDAYARASAGFMGKSWDTGEVAFAVEFWRQVLRVLKPGGHVVAFAGTRTYHRLAVAIEDSGFEIRDQIFWCYGSGFPKSHNVFNQLVEKGWACSCGKSMLSHHHATDENLRGLQEAVDSFEPVSSVSKPDVREGVRQRGPASESVTTGSSKTTLRDDHLPGMRKVGGEEARLAKEGQGADMLPSMQREITGRNVGGERLRSEGSTWAKPQPSAGKQSGLEGRGHVQAVEGELQGTEVRPMPGGVFADGAEGRVHNGTSPKNGGMGGAFPEQVGSGSPQGSQSPKQRSREPRVVADKRRPQAWGGWPVCGGCGKPIIPDGLGTALKPAHEPIVLARKPLIGTVAANVLAHGTGAINIDGCRIEGEESTRRVNRAEMGYHGGNLAQEYTTGSDAGRFPANILHDNSDEVRAYFPDAKGQQGDLRGHNSSRKSPNGVFGEMGPAKDHMARIETDTNAARFFYSPKASKKDRGEGNTHPTVKPTDLMAYLCRMVTPPGGVVLDPFMGSGSTGKAAIREGFRFVGIEREAEYFEIALGRLL